MKNFDRLNVTRLIVAVALLVIGVIVGWSTHTAYTFEKYNDIVIVKYQGKLHALGIPITLQMGIFRAEQLVKPETE